MARRTRSPVQGRVALRLAGVLLAALSTFLGIGGCGEGGGGAATTAAPSLTVLFRADSLDGPESVAWDGRRSRYLVTNVAGGEEGGGRGFISAVSENGRDVVRKAYRSGQGRLRLDAPKGISVRGDTAYVADLRRVVALDLAADSVLFQLRIPESRFLNDVAVNAGGQVFVSDTHGDALFHVASDGSGYERLAAPGSLRRPNGLLARGVGEPLLIAGWDGALVALNPDTSVTLLAEAPGFRNLDGIQSAPGGGVLVTDFTAGRLQHLRQGTERVWRTGTVWLDGLEGPADFLVRDSVLALPELEADRVTFYRIAPRSGS